MSIRFGDCNCSGVKANLAIIQFPFHGLAPFNDSTTGLTNYLRCDRVIVAGTTTDFGRRIYEGYYIVNKWTGEITLSDPIFQSPLDWSPDIFSDVTATSRTITLARTSGDLVMVETLSTPWTATERRNQVLSDLVNTVDWNDPFIFDLAHWIEAYFKYDTNGGLILNPNIGGGLLNPLVFGYSCQYSMVVSQDLIGSGNGGQASIAAMRRASNSRVIKSVGGQTPLFYCGDPPGDAFEESYIESAYSIILPPTQEEIQSTGVLVGTLGHTSILSC